MRFLRLAAFLVVLLPSLTANAGVDEGRKAFMAANYTAAWKELNPLAKGGNAEAQYLLGVMYGHGNGVKRSAKRSAHWYAAAAKQGHADAAFNLGFMLYQDEKYGAAGPWLLKAADAGNGLAASLVGGMYRDGLGLPKDAPSAYAWTLNAANKGIAGAQYEAGLMCAKMITEKRCTYPEAYKWFRLVAKTGYPGAAENADALAKRMNANEIREGDDLVKAYRPNAEAKS